MSIKITCYDYEIDRIKNIISNGLKVSEYPFGESCGWNCTPEKEKCKKCKEHFMKSIEWYNLETEGVRHNPKTGNWYFHPAEKIEVLDD